jgi:tetratricopeptide (TPR) repeat protein
MSISRWTTRLLVVLLAALPLTPIAWDVFYPATYAKWLLADAANQYDSGNVAQAQQRLLRAYQLSPEIGLDLNFWQQLARIELSAENSVSDAAIFSMILRKMPNESQRSAVAAVIAELMIERRMYGNALAVLKEFLPSRETRNPQQNNLIAYVRSLAMEDLEEALEEIDLALKRLKNESLLDTKAWVLHQMGRHREALVEIDRGIDMLLGNLQEDPNFAEVLDYMGTVQSENKRTNAEEVQREEKMGVGWAYQKLHEAFPGMAEQDIRYLNLATLRYHRWRILVALGEKARSEEDFRWLEAFAPKPWDLLH